MLLSGRGSNFLALHEAIAEGALPAEIRLVLSNVVGAPGIDRAKDLGLPTLVLPHRDAPSRKAHDRAVVAALQEAKVEWVCLAGYMRLLTSEFVQAFPHRILNIHPSLLPAFPGLHARQQAIEHGVRRSGCTVHLVDEGLDSGPIVVQRSVPVYDTDTEERLATRILDEEHKAYPAALHRLLTENWALDGRNLRFGNSVPEAKKDR